MEKEFYINVGFMKTGTSYLQKNIYPNLDKKSIYYVKREDVIFKTLQRLVKINEFNFSVEKERELIESFCKEIKQKKIFISWEALIGRTYSNFQNHHFIAESLKGIFENVKIIMVIRKQDDFAESIYIQSLHEGYSKSIKQFFNYEKGNFREYKPNIQYGINIDMNQINYKQFYDNYVRIFHASNVLVLPYELLKENHDTFIKKLCFFMDINYNFDENNIEEIKKRKTNRSYSYLSARIAMLLNPLIISERCKFGIIKEKPFYSFLIKKKDKHIIYKILFEISRKMTLRTFLQYGLDKIIYIKTKILSKEVKKNIMRIHYDNNKILDQELDLDLKKYKYYE